MARTPSDKDYVENRSLGRRGADRGVCLYHDMCHDTVSEIKQGCINHLETSRQEFEKMEDTIKTIANSKLDSWYFKLFLATVIPMTLAVSGWVGYNAFETVKILSRLDANQQHLMQEFQIEPIKK